MSAGAVPAAGVGRQRAGAACMGSTMMHVLARAHPELAAFTPDATLTEIKVKYGLSSFEDVLALGRRRLAERAPGTRLTAKGGLSPELSWVYVGPGEPESRPDSPRRADRPGFNDGGSAVA